MVKHRISLNSGRLFHSSATAGVERRAVQSWNHHCCRKCAISVGSRSAGLSRKQNWLPISSPEPIRRLHFDARNAAKVLQTTHLLKCNVDFLPKPIFPPQTSTASSTVYTSRHVPRLKRCRAAVRLYDDYTWGYGGRRRN